MNETNIQTIRGGIQRVMHLAKDHWTQEPTRYGFNYHHEPYGHIPASKLSKLVREARNETWEEYAWLCHENRYPILEQMAAQMLECGSFTEFPLCCTKPLSSNIRLNSITLSQKYSHCRKSIHTVAKALVNIDGTEYRTI